MLLLYIVVAVCLVFVVFIRVIVALGVGCRILLSYFYNAFMQRLMSLHLLQSYTLYIYL